eukprot:Seg3769.2 transcript_id=Seg3769.2/GoldUCD/mRNA.D3Y31 product="hypothetical protein" protein_id=Seg3769.2/GoldUCD/D3Y31
MAYFPSEQSNNPFGGPPSYLHQLRQKTVAIDPPPGAPAGAKPQHYGEQVMIPSALYPVFINTMKEHLENLEENKAMYHMEMAKRHANDPNKYRNHFNNALLYYNVAQSKNINDMIRNKLTDSSLTNIDKQIAQLKSGKQLRTADSMARYKQLQNERNRRKDILMESETKAYNRYLTNPFTSMNERPKTLPENHAQRELSGFLRNNRGVAESNSHGHLVIDGKTVSHDPQDSQKLIHYLLKDIRGPAPKGVTEMLNAMHKRGFDYKNNLGNSFLKEKLEKRKVKQTKRTTGANSAPPPGTTRFNNQKRKTAIDAATDATSTPRRRHTSVTQSGASASRIKMNPQQKKKLDFNNADAKTPKSTTPKTPKNTPKSTTPKTSQHARKEIHNKTPTKDYELPDFLNKAPPASHSKKLRRSLGTSSTASRLKRKAELEMEEHLAGLQPEKKKKSKNPRAVTRKSPVFTRALGAKKNV